MRYFNIFYIRHTAPLFGSGIVDSGCCQLTRSNDKPPTVHEAKQIVSGIFTEDDKLFISKIDITSIVELSRDDYDYYRIEDNKEHRNTITVKKLDQKTVQCFVCGKSHNEVDGFSISFKLSDSSDNSTIKTLFRNRVKIDEEDLTIYSCKSHMTVLNDLSNKLKKTRYFNYDYITSIVHD